MPGGFYWMPIPLGTIVLLGCAYMRLAHSLAAPCGLQLRSCNPMQGRPCHTYLTYPLLCCCCCCLPG